MMRQLVCSFTYAAGCGVCYGHSHLMMRPYLTVSRFSYKFTTLFIVGYISANSREPYKKPQQVHMEGVHVVVDSTIEQICEC